MCIILLYLHYALQWESFQVKFDLIVLTGLNHHPYQSSHPGNNRLDLNIAARDNLSSFTQRVMSAKLLRLKQLQNQLAEAHLQLNVSS